MYGKMDVFVQQKSGHDRNQNAKQEVTEGHYKLLMKQKKLQGLSVGSCLYFHRHL